MPNCIGLIVVTPLRDYRVGSALLSLDIEMTDYRRAYDDAVADEKFLPR